MQQEQQDKLVLPKYFYVLQILGVISLGLGGGAMSSQRREFLVEKLPILASTPLDWMLLLCGVVFILSINVIIFKAVRRRRNLVRPSSAEQRKHADLIEQRSSHVSVVLTPFSDGARPDALRFMPYTAIPFVLWVGMALMNKRVVNAAGVLILIVLPAAMFLFAFGSPLFCRVELNDNQISYRGLLLRNTLRVAEIESVKYQSAAAITSLVIRTATKQLRLSSLSFSAKQLATIRKYCDPSIG